MTQNITQPADAMAPPVVMELYAQKARLLLKGSQELLSSGMTGVTRVAFAFSEDWEGLQKTAVFSNGTVTIDVPEEDWEETVCTVPQQVLATAGKTLMVGLYGTDGGKRMLPTVWCALGRVEPGAVPTGVAALPPEAPLWARLQKQLGDVAATNPFVVKGLSMLPRDDDSITLELNRSFEEIQEAAQAGRPVFLEVLGAVLPLTRLIAEKRAEFTGAVFTTEGRAYYHFCTVSSAGDAVVQTLPVGSADAEETIREALAQAKASGEFDGPAGQDGKSAYQYAKDGGYSGTEAQFSEKLAKDALGGEKSDWSAEEGEPGYIQNRTHYSKMEHGIVLSETSLPFVEEAGAFAVLNPFSVVTGLQYTVNWNGVPYTCTCAEMKDGDVTLQFLGNALVIGGDDTGEPFAMAVANDEQVAEAGYYAAVVPLDGASSVTLSVSGMKEIVTPLPAKYLPKLRGQQHFVIDLDTGKASIPFEEAATMDLAELQAAASVIYKDESFSVSSIKSVTEVILGKAYDMFEICCAGRENGVSFRWAEEPGGFMNVQETISVPKATHSGKVLGTINGLHATWVDPDNLSFSSIDFREGANIYGYLSVNSAGQLELRDKNNIKFATFSPDGTAGAGQDEVPSYVAAESEAVIDRVLAAQGENTFIFAAISDLHYGEGSYTDGIKHACQAINRICKTVKVDAFCSLGDIASGYTTTDNADAVSDFKTINRLFAEIRPVVAVELHQQGNHDYIPDNIHATRQLIQFFTSNGVVWGSRAGGYYHRDFEDHKLRIICPNTNENNPVDPSTIKPSSSISMTDEQLRWFVDVLDLSEKDDAERWQILILSHQPMDYWVSDSKYRLSYILNAYQTGGSWTDGTISCNFAGKNKAKLICNIHGHIHNLLMEQMFLGNSNSATKTGVYRMSTPNACLGRENQYAGAWGEGTTYTKTRNSGKDTAFVVYCIDLSDHKITAVCYGAGYDRVLNYLDETVPEIYTVTNNLTYVTNSNSTATITEGQGYTATLTPAGGTLQSVMVVMGGVDVTATAYAHGQINISSVTGDIVITAVGDAPANYINQIPLSINSDGTQYVGSNGEDGYKVGYRLDSGGVEKAINNSFAVTGFIPAKLGDTVYVKDMVFRIGNNDDSYCYLSTYDSNFALLKGGTALNIATNVGATYTTDGTSENNLASFTIDTSKHSSLANCAYIRMSYRLVPGKNAIITVNEPIG